MTIKSDAKPRALVSGGAGFIGSHLTELLLERGHEVTVIDNLSMGRIENLAHLKGYKTLKFVKADISRIGEISGHLVS